MATQKVVNELVDALLSGHVAHYIDLVEQQRDSFQPLRHPWSFAYVTQVSFMYPGQWDLLKKALKIDDDQKLLERVRKNRSVRQLESHRRLRLIIENPQSTIQVRFERT